MKGPAFRQGEHLGRAVHRVEKFDRKVIMQVWPARMPRFPRPPPQQLSEDVVRFGEIRVACTVFVGVAGVGFGREILVISLARPFSPRSVDLSAIKPLTLVRIRKQIVGA